jgi:DNA-binding transcriptional LysR family regulator
MTLRGDWLFNQMRFVVHSRQFRYTSPGEKVARSLNSRQIEAFRALMITGTTTASAEMLNTTQPSISRLLSQIQSTTGLKLFELSRGRLNPTPQFRRQYEGVDISLHIIPSRQLKEGLLNGLHDVGLTTTSFHFSGDEFETEVLDQRHAVCVMSKNHALATRRRIEPADFARNTLLTLESGDDLTDAWRGILSKNNIVPASIIETTYSATICALAEAEMGIGVVSPYVTAIMADRVRTSLSPQLCRSRPFCYFPAIS